MLTSFKEWNLGATWFHPKILPHLTSLVFNPVSQSCQNEWFYTHREQLCDPLWLRLIVLNLWCRRTAAISRTFLSRTSRVWTAQVHRCVPWLSVGAKKQFYCFSCLLCLAELFLFYDVLHVPSSCSNSNYSNTWILHLTEFLYLMTKSYKFVFSIKGVKSTNISFHKKKKARQGKLSENDFSE